MLTLINKIVKTQNELNEVVCTKVFREGKKLDAICITTVHEGKWNYIEVTEIEREALSQEYLQYSLGLVQPVVDIIKYHKIQEIVCNELYELV